MYWLEESRIQDHKKLIYVHLTSLSSRLIRTRFIGGRTEHEDMKKKLKRQKGKRLRESFESRKCRRLTTRDELNKKAGFDVVKGNK